MTRTDIAIDGVPSLSAIVGIPDTVTTTFEHPKGFEVPDFFETELHPLSATVTGTGDEMQDMSFVENLTLTLSSRAEGAPEPIVVASYERGAAGSTGRVMRLVVDRDPDVLSYWETKSAYYELSVSGTLPEQAWAIDVSVAFSGSISVSSSD